MTFARTDLTAFVLYFKALHDHYYNLMMTKNRASGKLLDTVKKDKTMIADLKKNSKYLVAHDYFIMDQKKAEIAKLNPVIDQSLSTQRKLLNLVLAINF